ncbi:MAG TPA: hypothetical protein VFI29_23885 [Hanamia sp.]|nr:hypothetical protein [Hanamia sp.]
MDLDKLNFLPDWEDERFSEEEEEGEAWKTDEIRSAGKALYLKWREVFGLVLAFTENLADESEENETHEQSTQRLIYENAMIIAPKIRSATMVDMYVLQMENAAIIRTNARQLMEQVGFAVLMGFADEGYKKVIEEAMNEFRELFKNWVATFQKDDFEDEWGLFV